MNYFESLRIKNESQDISSTGENYFESLRRKKIPEQSEINIGKEIDNFMSDARKANSVYGSYQRYQSPDQMKSYQQESKAAYDSLNQKYANISTYLDQNRKKFGDKTVTSVLLEMEQALSGVSSARSVTEDYTKEFSKYKDEKSYKTAHVDYSAYDFDAAQKKLKQLKDQQNKPENATGTSDIIKSFFSKDQKKLKSKKNASEISALENEMKQAESYQSAKKVAEERKKVLSLFESGYDESAAEKEIANLEMKMARISRKMKEEKQSYVQKGLSAGVGTPSESTYLSLQKEFDAVTSQRDNKRSELNSYKQYKAVKQYERLEKNSDFSELSQKVDTEKAKKSSGTNYGIINSPDGFSSGLYKRAMGNIVHPGEESDPLFYITENQRSLYNYLFNKKGSSAADQYIETIKPDLERQRAEDVLNTRNELANKHPLIASAYSTAVNTVSGLGIFEDYLKKLQNQDIDVNSASNLISQEVDQIRQTVSEQYASKFLGDVKIYGQSAGSFLYQTLMSISDFTLNQAISSAMTGGIGSISDASGAVQKMQKAIKAGGNLSLAMIGTQAATRGVLDAKERGLDDQTALKIGTISGLAEIITEKVSIEALLGNPTNVAAYIAKNTFSEGSEEVASDMINLFADLALSGDQAQMKQAVQHYKNMGYSEAEAWGNAINDQADQSKLSFLGGALSGFAFSGAPVAADAISQHAENYTSPSQRTDIGHSVIASGVTKEVNDLLGKNADGQNLMNKVQKTTQAATSQESTAKQIKAAEKKLGGAFLKAVRSGLLPEDIVMRVANESAAPSKQVGKYIQEEDKTKAVLKAAKMTDNTLLIHMAAEAERTNNPVDIGRLYQREVEAGIAPQIGSEDIQREADSAEISPQAKELMVKSYDGADSIAYASDFQTFYRAGKNGATWNVAKSLVQKMNNGVMTTRQAREAFDLGASERASGVKEKAAAEQVSVKRGKGQLSFTDAAMRADITEKQSAAVNVLGHIANTLGVDIEIFSDPNGPVNGSYSPSTGKYRINLDAWADGSGTSGMLNAMAHEITHAIKDQSPLLYEQLQTFVLEKMEQATSAQKVADLVRRQQLFAGQMNEQLDDDAALEEVVANACEKMLQDGSALRQLEQTNRSLWEKIKSWFQSILNDLKKGYADEQTEEAEIMKPYLNEMQKIWNEGFADLAVRTDNSNSGLQSTANVTQKNTAKKSDTKYSIAYTTENNPVAVIENDILDGVPKSKWIETVKKTMSDQFSDGIPISGRLVKVNIKTRNEYTNSKNTQYYRKNSNQRYEDKLKSSNNLDDIVLASTNYINENLLHERKDNFKEFARGDVLIRIGTNDYTAKVVVGYTSGNQMVLYDIIDFMPTVFEIKKAGMRSPSNFKNEENSSNIPADTNVSQNDTSVNTNISDSSKKDAASEKNSINQKTSGRSELEELANRVEKLDEANAQLRERLKAAQDRANVAESLRPSVKQIRTFISGICKEFGSKADQNKLVANYAGISAYMEKSPDANFQTVMERCSALADEIIGSGGSFVRDERASQVLDAIKSVPFTMNDAQKAEAASEYEGMINYLRKVMGIAKYRSLQSGNIGLDQAWQQWSEQYPDIFDKTISDADQPLELARIIDRMKQAGENYVQSHRDELTKDLTTRLYEQQFQIDSEGTTVEKVQAEDAIRYEKALSVVKQMSAKKLAAVRRSGMLKQETALKNQKATMQALHDRDIARKIMLDLAQQLKKPTKKKHVPEVLQKTVSEVLQQMDWWSSRIGRKQESGMDAYRSDQQMRDTIDDLARAIKSVSPGIESGEIGQMDIDPSILSDIENIKIVLSKRNLKLSGSVGYQTAEEMRLIKTILLKLRHAVNGVNKAYTAHASIDTLGKQTIKEMGDQVQSKLSKKKDGGMRKHTNTEDWFVWGNLLPIYGFDKMGGAAQTIFKSFQKGMGNYAFLVKEIQDFVQKNTKPEEIKKWSKKVRDIDLENGNTIHMTDTQIMSFYNTVNRESTKSHLEGIGIRPGEAKDIKTRQTEPMNLTQNDIQKILATLTDRQKNVCRLLQQFCATRGAELGNETHMKRFGYRAFTEESYWPMSVNQNETRTTGNDGETQKSETNLMYRILNPGFANPLSENASNSLIIDDVFHVFVSHMTEMAAYNTMALPVMDAMHWINYNSIETDSEDRMTSRNVKAALESRYGKAAEKFFNGFIKNINGEAEKGQQIGFVSEMIKNIKVSSVGANLRVVILQPTAYVRASAVIDPKYLAAGFRKSPRAGIEYAKKYCGIALWKSMGYFNTNVTAPLEKIITDNYTFRERVQEKSLALAGKADEITWGVLWNACAAWAKDNNPNGYAYASEAFNELVSEKLEEVIYRTQVVDSVLTKPASMTAKDTYTKMATAFASEPLQTYNLLQSGLSDLSSATTPAQKKAAGKKISRCFGAWVATQVLTAVVEAIPGAARDDDDYEEWWQKYGDAFLDALKGNLNPLGNVPILRDVMSIIQGFDVSRMDMDAVSDAVRAVKAWASYIEKVIAKEEPSTTWYALIYKTAKPVAEFSGIPYSAAVRELATLYNTVSRTIYEDAPKWQTSKDTAKSGALRWMQAMEAGNQPLAQKIRGHMEKNGIKDVDGSLASVLKDSDDRVYEAAQARLSGEIEKHDQLMRELKSSGYGDPVVESAIERVYNEIKPEKEKKEEDKGYTHSASMIILALDNGKAEDAGYTIEQIVDEKTQQYLKEGKYEGEEEKKAYSSVRSSLSSHYKPFYIAAYNKDNLDECNRLEEMLLSLDIGYEFSDFAKWQKSAEESKESAG